MKKLASTILVLWSALVCAAFAPLYVPAINVVSDGNPCSSLDSSTTALVARMTVDPGCPRKIVINDLIVSLKTAGIWSKLDALYLFAAADSQAAKLNWIGTSYTAITSLSFTTDRGFTGDAINSISSAFNPNTGSTNYSLNSAHFGGWSRTSSADTAYALFVNQAVYQNIRGSPRGSSGAFRYQINSATISQIANASGAGHFLMVRPNSTQQVGYMNGTAVQAAQTANSTALSNYPLTFLANSADGSTSQISAGHFGSALTATEAADFHTALQTYMTAVGAYP